MKQVVLQISVLVLVTALQLVLAIPVREARAAIQKVNRWGIIITNQDHHYTYRRRDAARDGEAVGRMFHDVLGIPPSRIIENKNMTKGQLEYLFGTSRTVGNIRNRITGPGTELYVYFSGYGSRYLDKRRGLLQSYLLATDSRPESLPTTGYALKTLVENLQRLRRGNFPAGRVVVMLEAGFSGTTAEGDLIANVNAPSLGGLKRRIRKKVKLKAQRQFTGQKGQGLIMISATAGQQVARRDGSSRIGVFTDSLVNGFYGEADKRSFNGNNDRTVTIGELKSFLRSRMKTRSRKKGAGKLQSPGFLGSLPDQTPLVTLDQKTLPRIGMIARQHEEFLRAKLVFASGAISRAEDYLKKCLYCPDRTVIRSWLDKKKSRKIACTAESRLSGKLEVSGTVTGIKAFLRDCSCCSRRRFLERRMARLEEAGRNRYSLQPSHSDRERRDREKKVSKERTGPGRPGKKLDEKQLWRKAISAQTTEGYRDYLKSYPSGRYAARVTRLLRAAVAEDSYWQEVTRLDRLKGYRNYLRAYPEGRYSEQSRKKIIKFGSRG